jgi:oligopeptide transport system substrate-binding protein
MITLRNHSFAASLVILLASTGACVLPAAAQERSVLTVARTSEFASLDPPREFDQPSDQVLKQVYSTLLTYAYLERPYKLEPDLLESMPTLAADKVTYTFKLRKGVRFIDNACFPGGKGRELTSDDVLYTLKRYADANVNNKSWFAMEGAVVGLDAFRAATAKAGTTVDVGKMEVAGLRKIDAQTFTIKLTHENPLFLFSLAIAPTSVVPVEAVRMYKDRLSVTPVGTGPFMTKDAEATRKGTLHLVRNPNYYRVYPSVGAPGDAEKGLLKDAGKKLPLVDALDMPLIEEAQPAALKFLRGDLDRRELDRANFTRLVTRGPDGSLKLGDAYAAKFNLQSASGGNLIYINLNMKDPLLGRNKALRQALASAVDPSAIVNVLLNGRGHLLQSIVPYDLPGSERDTGAVARKHDVAAAKKLLVEAGFPDGKGLPPMTMTFPEADAETHNLFDMLKAQFAEVGVQLNASFNDIPTFMKATDGGNFQMAYYSWYADYPDAEDFYGLLYGRNLAPGPNSGSFVNPAYDKAYEASRYMANGPQRFDVFKSLNALIKDESPVIVVYERVRIDVVQKWIGNFKRNIFVPENAFTSVDMALKKKGL